MTSSLEHLAAAAAAAVPGLRPAGVAPSPDDDADFRSAVVLDASGRRWRVRSPLSPEASVRLETEHLVLRSFTPAVRSRLPFLVPTAAGSVAGAAPLRWDAPLTRIPSEGLELIDSQGSTSLWRITACD